MNNTMLLLSILLTGLVGGLMYGWTVSVLPGLRAVDAPTYLNTMQTVNRKIINPAFTVPFTATPFVLAVASVVLFRSGDSRRGWLLASSALIYLVGVVGVTVGGNIPLNNKLDVFELAGATDAALADLRQHYEGSWNAWHYARTVASVLTLIVCSVAAIVEAEGS